MHWIFRTSLPSTALQFITCLLSFWPAPVVTRVVDRSGFTIGKMFFSVLIIAWSMVIQLSISALLTAVLRESVVLWQIPTVKLSDRTCQTGHLKMLRMWSNAIQKLYTLVSPMVIGNACTTLCSSEECIFKGHVFISCMDMDAESMPKYLVTHLDSNGHLDWVICTLLVKPLIDFSKGSLTNGSV